MQSKKKLLTVTILGIIAVLIKLFSLNKSRVENGYTGNLYMTISKCLRFLFGWLPFSIGDVLYGIAFIWFLWRLILFVKMIVKKRMNKMVLKKYLYNFTVALLIIYCLFNILWGINYNRKGIAHQLGLVKEKYDTAELKIIDSILLEKVNESKTAMLQKTATNLSTKEIFAGAVSAYNEVNKEHSFLVYNNTSVKRSMWGWLGNYIGFIGYYNPFTGEANVNTTVPTFLQPYTVCHEMAHQLGYAKENEANFVGYLAATASKDTFFHYSVYLDLFIYANRTLYNVDSASAKNFSKQLLPEIKLDLQVWKKFMQEHKNPIEPGIRWMYGKFLESNEQPSGVLTYDEVTGLLIAYYKKYGHI